MLIENKAKNEFKRITQEISVAINRGKNKDIWGDTATGKTAALIEAIKHYHYKFFIVFTPTQVVADIYRKELQGYNNYKLINARTSRKTECMRGLVDYIVFFDDIDMIFKSGGLSRSEFKDITLIANAGRASVITTSRS